MGKMNVKEFTDEELAEISIAIRNEQEYRREGKERGDWNKVVNAMTAYIEKYGQFIVSVNDGEDEIYIESDSILTQYPGVILVYS